jgi:outer membrane lipase/esterase
MIQSTVRPWSFAVGALVLVLALPGAPAARLSLERLVVFGTSLSDPGNAFALTHATTTPPYDTLDAFLVPSASYATGGQHFSNGPTWVEQFAQSRGLSRSTQPAFQNASPWATNFAIATSRARTSVATASLGFQVAAFLTAANGVAPEDALYVIEMGTNDLRDALLASLGGGNGSAIVTDATAAIGDSIAALYAAGARKFLVWNSPNIALTPAVGILDALVPVDVASLATLLTVFFNANLQAELATLAALPDIEIVDFDAFQMFNAVAAAPGAFGLSVVNMPCVIPNVAPFHCDAPDAYLFWDGIHPTRAAHGLIADAAAARLAQP